MQAADVVEKYGLDPSVVERAIEEAKRSVVKTQRTIAVREKGKVHPLLVSRLGVGPLEIDGAGVFELFDFDIDDPWRKYSVLVRSDLGENFRPSIFPLGPVLMRVDSGCETGQLFGDRTCECKNQLVEALVRIHEHGSGMVINIPRQDGRGMGLPFKLATLRLQRDLGVDTVESGALLDPNKSRDIRTYAGVVAILKFFGATEDTPLRILTNNPKKLAIFQENGFKDVQPVGIVIEPTEHTERHLKAKQDELGHVGLVSEAKK